MKMANVYSAGKTALTRTQQLNSAGPFRTNHISQNNFTIKRVFGAVATGGTPVTRLRKENASVTTIALVILAVCSIIGALSSKITRADLNLSNAYIQQKQAFYAAESGLNYAAAKMSSLTDSPDDPYWSVTVHGNLPTGESFAVVVKHKVAGGKVVKWADASGDFVFKECTSCPGSPVERIVSTGYGRGGSQQSVATELFPEPLFADVPAALYAGGDSMISTSGASVAEGEYGYFADRAVCVELPDVVTTASALDGYQATDFKGMTGLRASLLNDQSPYPLAKVIDSLKGRATTFAPDAYLALGSSEDYGLYYCLGNVDAEHLSGYGVLIIDGNARFRGRVDWHGLILVKGNSQFEGTGGKEIFGGFLSGGGVFIDSSPAFYHDCREMNKIKKKFSRYGRRMWMCDAPLNW